MRPGPSSSSTRASRSPSWTPPPSSGTHRRSRTGASCWPPPHRPSFPASRRGVEPMSRLTVNVDGGARGNPGPAAVGAVLRNGDGEILERRAERIGRATNNVAEYRAMLLGIELAAAHGATAVDLVGDSELI